MTTRRLAHGLAFALGWLIVMSATGAHAQDIARAKSYYASASYEEALGVLSALHGKATPPEATEISMYEVFCLVALGRGDDARRVIESIVRENPEYHLTDEQASPRVRAMFDTFRTPLLPDIVRDSYTKGREAFDQKDFASAMKNFDRVLALTTELEPIKDASLRDIRTLASGFRDLGRIALAEKPAAAPAPTTPAAPAPGGPNAAAAPPPSTPAAPAARPQTQAAAPVDPRHIYVPGDANVKPAVPAPRPCPRGILRR
jgi:hypothetical protein